jgi:hypothetical protein
MKVESCESQPWFTTFLLTQRKEKIISHFNRFALNRQSNYKPLLNGRKFFTNNSRVFLQKKELQMLSKKNPVLSVTHFTRARNLNFRQITKCRQFKGTRKKFRKNICGISKTLNRAKLNSFKHLEARKGKS